MFPETKEGLEELLRQRIVFDIGQIPPKLHEWLIRQVRKGKVQRTMNYQRFPNGKFMYWIVDGEPPL